MTATKNPTPDEMAGADSMEDAGTASVRHAKKARKLRRGHTDETDQAHPGYGNLSAQEQASAGRAPAEDN